MNHIKTDFLNPKLRNIVILTFHDNMDTVKKVVDRKPPYKYVLGILYCCFTRSQCICCILQLRPVLLLETVLLLFPKTLTRVIIGDWAIIGDLRSY